MSVISTASSVPPAPHPRNQGELAVHGRRVTVDGIHTQYLEAGAGPPLLLVHGHEQSAASWRWVIPALARTHRVLWRIPAAFVAEQHTLGRRPGQLEASTAMARALFGLHGQRLILLDRLPTLTTPTLIIWGGCDYLLPARHAQTAVNLLPDGRLALFADCGHLPQVECPDRFAAVLGAWLTEHQEIPTA